MAWIKVQTTLIDDPAVATIAQSLKMADAHVVGCLVSIWAWADSLTADGFVQHATSALVDKKAGKKGFAHEMARVGWLVVEPSGVLFPKWDRHNGESAKARAGEAEAKRLLRSGVRRSSGPATESAPLATYQSGQMSGQMSGQNGDTCPDQRRGEEIRGEKNKTVGRADSSAPAPPKPSKQPEGTQSDEAWMASLVTDTAYAHVNISAEYAKMVRWCEVNRKQPSRRRFINWVNRIERPMPQLFSQPVRVQT